MNFAAAMIEAAPDGVMLLSRDGIVELANPRAEQLFGYSGDEEQIRVRAARGLPADVIGWPINLGEGVAGRIAARGPRVYHEPREVVAPKWRDHVPREITGVPLTLGALVVCRKLAFDDDNAALRGADRARHRPRWSRARHRARAGHGVLDRRRRGRPDGGPQRAGGGTETRPGTPTAVSPAAGSTRRRSICCASPTPSTISAGGSTKRWNELRGAGPAGSGAPARTG